MEEYVILVDGMDRPVGTCGKLEAHLQGLLHRAISVFIFNSKGEMLLQQRAHSKYHSGGLWTNACCSHPRVGEDSLNAAHRRLFEEMGMHCDLKKVFAFEYRAQVGELIEHEYDHVFIGFTDAEPQLNLEESCAARWINQEDLEREVSLHPERFTPWFKLIYQRAWSLPDQPSLERSVEK